MPGTFDLSESFIESFNGYLFWDTDPGKLDAILHRRYIIERIFSFGNINDIRKAVEFYGKDLIAKEIVLAGSLDKKTLNWISLVFNIPKMEFRCYMKRQSAPLPWNY